MAILLGKENSHHWHYRNALNLFAGKAEPGDQSQLDVAQREVGEEFGPAMVPYILPNPIRLRPTAIYLAQVPSDILEDFVPNNEMDSADWVWFDDIIHVSNNTPIPTGKRYDKRNRVYVDTYSYATRNTNNDRVLISEFVLNTAKQMYDYARNDPDAWQKFANSLR